MEDPATVEAHMNVDKEKMGKIKHHNTQCINVGILILAFMFGLISHHSDMVGD